MRLDERQHEIAVRYVAARLQHWLRAWLDHVRDSRFHLSHPVPNLRRVLHIVISVNELSDAIELQVHCDDLLEGTDEHTSELQSPDHLVCRLLLEKKKQIG